MDMLVVTSKVKAKVKAEAKMHTSGEVPEALTKHVGRILDLAIKRAQSDGRKTVMGRDIELVLKDFQH